jgi:hypothetical protein
MIKTKIRKNTAEILYEVVALPTLQYGSKSWGIKARNIYLNKIVIRDEVVTDV